jgi:ABC-type glycerol-3-phosphate transport system substrate-binding protein
LIRDWLIGLSIVALVACAPSSPAQSVTPTPATSSSAAAPPETRSSETRVPTRTPITTTTAITLTLWTTEDLAPGNSPAGRILRNQFDAFTAAHPNIYIEPVLKRPYGKGGVLDFVLTTHAVVPAQLPDLVALDISEIPLAAEPGILQSLDGWLPPELSGDFFPFAYRAARYQNQWVAIPFAVDAQHLVYNKTVVKKPPRTWDDLYRQKQQIILPLGGDDAFLVQYSAIAPLNDNPAPLDWASVTLVLNFVKRTRDLGLLNDAALNAKNVEELWAPFAAGQIPLAQVSVSRFLAEQAKSPNAQFAPLPTRDGKTATMASGWAFAIITKDPARQTAAARFIHWITQGQRLAPWLRAAQRLPAVRSAMPLAVEEIEYAAFLRDALENAVYLPRTPAYARASAAWRAAIANVWKGQLTPEDAARAVTGTK